MIFNQAWFSEKRIPLSVPFRKTLLSTDSLTKRLGRLCGAQIFIQPLFEGIQPLYPDEAEILNPQEETWVREVLLKCHHRPLVFARTLVPTQSSTQLLGEIRHLGQVPLGQWLFEQERQICQRDFINYKGQPPRQYPQLRLSWARRTLYEIRGQKLLVQEAFIKP